MPQRRAARTHTHAATCTCQIGATYIYIYTIYICVYSRIVQVSRFHLCARRELKTSPSCNVTETVTKYQQPPSPLAAPLSKVQMQTVQLNETQRNLRMQLTNSMRQILCKKGKGKLTAVCTVEVKFRSACRGHYKCISHIAYRSH